MTVTDLMDDKVMLDGVIMKCNSNAEMARADVTCANARTALERIAAQNEAATIAQRQAEFERSRERLRLAQERERLQQEAATKVDPYALPVIPVDPAPAAAAAATATGAPAPQANGAPAAAQGQAKP